MIKKIPVNCPSCEHLLTVTSLQCPNCETMVSGRYQLPLLASLTNEEQEFILNFFKESGKLNTMAKQLNVSYPTLRNRLDDLIEKVKRIEEEQNEQS